MNTSEAYWRGPEPKLLCDGEGSNPNINYILALPHGPPTITPIPNSKPCSETIMCDPARYNTMLEIANIGGVLECGEGNVAFFNSLNPFQCDKKKSGFLDPANRPAKSYLCYFNSTIG